MSGVLEGLRILEMGHVVAVPAASATMSDWGADVIKVEPLTGDMARGIGVPLTAEQIALAPPYAAIGMYFQVLNRGKRSIALNLKAEEGRKAFYKLVAWADVFMTNYEVATLAKLGADYESLAAVNPALIYCVLTGYGTVGPDKDERGFDYSAAWARSGLMHMMASPRGIPPPQRGGMMDRVAGAHVVSGILAALYHRSRTGKGQKLESSLYHVGVWTDTEDAAPALRGFEPLRHNRKTAGNPIWNNYKTKDNRWLWLANLQPDLTWGNFCRSIGHPEWENDPKYNTSAARFENSAELIRMIDAEMVKKTLREWEAIFRQNQVIYGRVQTPMEVVNDPQAKENGFFTPLKHPAFPDINIITTPVKFQQNPSEVRGPAPEIGQNTEEILIGFGYSWEDIAKMKEGGVIL